MTVQPLVRRFALSLAIVLTLGAAVALFLASPKVGTAGKSWAKFDRQGNLLRPEGYREWVYAGVT